MSDADCTPGREPRGVAASYTQNRPKWPCTPVGIFKPNVHNVRTRNPME